MWEDLARFIADGGFFLLAAVVTSLVAGVTAVVACIAGLVASSRSPGGDEPRTPTGTAMRVLVVAVACLPGALAVSAALTARYRILRLVSQADIVHGVLVTDGFRGVLNSSMVLALLLLVLPPVVAVALVIWGPMRARAIDRWHARRMEREVEQRS